MTTISPEAGVAPAQAKSVITLPRILLSLLFFCIAAPVVILLFYATPSSDDFCKATLSFNAVPQSGILSVTWHYYLEWSPRWLTTLLESLIMNKLNMVAWYGCLLLLAMLSNLAALWYFCAAVLGLTRGAALMAAVSFYLAWLYSVASPGETVFWLTGAMEYQLSISALLVLFSLLQQPRKAPWYYILLAVVSVWIPAEHELAGALVCSLLLAGTLFLLWRRRDAHRWMFALAMASLSFAIVMLAPGMSARLAHRRGHVSGDAPLLWYLKHALLGHGAAWLVFPAILLAALYIALLPKAKDFHSDNPALRWLALAGALAMCIILFEVAFVESSMSGEAPGRVIGWFQFGFWLMLVSAIVGCASAVQNIQAWERFRPVCLLLLAVALLLSHTFRAAVTDLGGTAEAWRQGNLSRLVRHHGRVEFANLPGKPQLFMRQALSSSPGCWVNRCMASYIGAEAVTVNGSRETCPE